MEPTLRRVLRVLLVVGALALAALPALAYASGRESLTLPLAAVALSALCSFLAYRGALLLRRRIDQIGEAGERRKP